MEAESERQQDCAEQSKYEAPRIESVMTAEQLEREVLYAGIPTAP